MENSDELLIHTYFEGKFIVFLKLKNIDKLRLPFMDITN